MKLIRKGEHNWLCAMMCFTAVLRTVRDLACLIAISYAMDQLLNSGAITSAMLLVIMCELTGTPILAFDAYVCQRYRVEKEKLILSALAEKSSQAELSWLESEKTSDLLSTCTADVQKYLNWLTDVFPNFIRTVAYLIGGLWYSFSQSVALTLCVFPIVAIVVPILASATKPLRGMADTERRAAGKSLGRIQEILMDPEFVKSYTLEQVMQDRVNDALHVRYCSECRSGTVQSFVKGLGKLMSCIPSIIAAGVGFLFLLKGSITVGFLFGFVQMAAQRFGFVIPQIGDILASTSQAMASAKRIQHFLDAPAEREMHGSLPEVQSAFAWELNHVSFAYQTGQPVVKDITMKVEKGQTIAVVGVSGSGKSTLLKLLMGIYQSGSGSMSCMGKDMKQWDAEALRHFIAPVFQTPHIFPMTIRENLSLGNRQYSDHELMEALEKVELAEYVEQLPDGLDHKLTQYGTSLSGGQRQRMALARIWLKDVPILLFDEATSALDTATEHSIQQTFEELKKGRTTVMIAHRLNTIKNADWIYVLDCGQIVEQGTHRQLLERDGIYQRLWMMQTNG